MPLQQINVTPFKPKENDGSSKERHIFVPSGNSQEVYGTGESQSSSQTSSGGEICRICHCEGDMEGGFIVPCYCSGSLRFVHQNCLQQWIKSSGIRCCELCKFQFIMQTKTKPFMQWEPLDMTEFERKKLFCAVIFQVIAIACVVWTLYALINGTAEEMNEGVMEWAFWAKLVLVSVAFTGGIFFMYVQCKSYLQICQRWRAYNKVIYVQNVPEKQPVDLDVPSSCESGTSRCNLPKSPQSLQDDGNFKDGTIKNLKGVRNTHLFFNDECRIYLHNEDRESQDSLVGLPPFLKLCRALGLT